MKIAIIGSGISGLSSALLLSQNHDITLIESDNRFGGHANTVNVIEQENTIPVDTGFIVYNELNYPNLVGFSEDPIVSSDVISSPLSLLVDLKGSMRVGTRLFKLIGWHGSLGHAHRITQLMVNYSDIDKADHAEVL